MSLSAGDIGWECQDNISYELLETIEAEPSVDSNNTLKQAGVAGGIGAAAALLATGATLLFRRRV